jgi:hypothetical protein
MSLSSPPKPLRIYLYSHPRTGSNLFCKLFSEHPSISQLKGPFFLEAWFGPESQIPVESEEMDKLILFYRPRLGEGTYQSSLDKLQTRIAEAQEVVSKLNLYLSKWELFVLSRER